MVFLWLCFCGCVFVVVFLWLCFCGGVFVVVWWCSCGGALFEVQMSKNCTPLWRDAHSQVEMFNKLTVSEHFLKFRCRKIARRSGGKRIQK